MLLRAKRSELETRACRQPVRCTGPDGGCRSWAATTAAWWRRGSSRRSSVASALTGPAPLPRSPSLPLQLPRYARALAGRQRDVDEKNFVVPRAGDDLRRQAKRLGLELDFFRSVQLPEQPQGDAGRTVVLRHRVSIRQALLERTSITWIR